MMAMTEGEKNDLRELEGILKPAKNKRGKNKWGKNKVNEAFISSRNAKYAF